MIRSSAKRPPVELTSSIMSSIYMMNSRGPRSLWHTWCHWSPQAKAAIHYNPCILPSDLIHFKNLASNSNVIQFYQQLLVWDTVKLLGKIQAWVDSALSSVAAHSWIVSRSWVRPECLGLSPCCTYCTQFTMFIKKGSQFLCNDFLHGFHN